MSKLSQLARIAPAGTSPDVSQIDLTARRSAVEAELREAERLHRKAAYDSEKGIPGAISAKVEAAGALQLAQERLRDVMAAQIEAEAERQERERAAREAARASKVTASKKHLALFVDAAAALVPVLAEAVRLYRLMHEHAEAASLASPSGLFFHGTMTRPPEIQHAVAQEISRLGGYSGDHALKARSFPGGSTAPGKVYLPESLEPMEQRIKRGVALALEALK